MTRALAAALLVLAPPAGAGRWAAAAVIAIVVFAGTWRVRRSVAPEPTHVDQLTGLPDRAAFEAVLDDEIARSRRYQAPLSLVLVDIDGFRAINEEHGTLCGDECLRDVADALAGALRGHDACFRHVGDRFAVLMPATSRPAADAACDRLQAAVALACRRPEGAPLAVTCAPAQLAAMMTPEHLIAAAETALLLRRAPRPEGRLAQVIPLRPRQKKEWAVQESNLQPWD